MFSKVKSDSRLGNRYELNNEELNNRHNCQNNLAEENNYPDFDNQSLLNSFISVEIIVLQFLRLIAKYNINDVKMSMFKSTHDAKIKHHSRPACNCMKWERGAIGSDDITSNKSLANPDKLVNWHHNKSSNGFNQSAGKVALGHL